MTNALEGLDLQWIELVLTIIAIKKFKLTMIVRYYTVKVFVDQIDLNGQNISIIRLTKIGKGMPVFKWDFKKAFKYQSGDVILTHPNLRTLRNVVGDGNCLFSAFSVIITGTEDQHMEVRNKILRYMISIENLVIGYDMMAMVIITIYSLSGMLVCRITLTVEF